MAVELGASVVEVSVEAASVVVDSVVVVGLAGSAVLAGEDWASEVLLLETADGLMDVVLVVLDADSGVDDAGGGGGG